VPNTVAILAVFECKRKCRWIGAGHLADIRWIRISACRMSVAAKLRSAGATAPLWN
jgi:hypothetical protein